MKKEAWQLSLVFVCSALLSSCVLPTDNELNQARQLIVVTTDDWNSVQGNLQRFERANRQGVWDSVEPSSAIVVGKAGLAWGKGIEGISKKELGNTSGEPIKQEGDNKAPAGVFSLGTTFGYAKQPHGWKMPYIQLSSSVECVDDVSSSFYNHIVDSSRMKSSHWSSAEHMLRNDGLYRWGVFVNHNTHPAQVGQGSCIFLHIWHGHDQGTAGCTAMSQSGIEKMFEWLDPDKSPVLIQIPRSKYEYFRTHLDGEVLPRLDVFPIHS